MTRPKHQPDPAPHITAFSAGGNGGNTGGEGSQDSVKIDSNDPKRSRACEACRGLKVRCEPDPNNTDGPCKRCAKANRNCVVTPPSRKRQKKTDGRVAELEKKINALTATLQAQGAGAATVVAATAGEGVEQLKNGTHDRVQSNPYQQVTNEGYGLPYVASRPKTGPNEWDSYPRAPESKPSQNLLAPSMVVASQKRKNFESFSAVSSSPLSPATGVQRQAQEAVGIFYSLDAANHKAALTHEYADVVDKGLATVEEATKMFNWYVEKMTPHMPAVVFSSSTTAAEIRKTKPTLFLAILNASAGILKPEKQRILTKEIMSIFADRVICSGDKSLELIQAIIVSCLWYWPPEHFEELKFYQLIHIASVMAIDIGMSKKSKLQKSTAAGLFRDNSWRRTPYPDPESLESRRTWLSCYFLCCNASMGLRRPNLIRWTTFMAECVEVLETSPDALPSDKNFCQWIRSQHIAEDIGNRFSMDDPSTKVSIADPTIQHALKGFEIELEDWVSKIPPEANSPCLQVTGHLINLYMHEVAVHVDHDFEEFKPPFTAALLSDNAGDEDKKLSSSHVTALSICLKSIDGIFGSFLEFDVDTVRSLPVANFVRVAYAVVVLIKMYFAAANPKSHFGKVINKDNMKVEQYLDGLEALFKAAAHEDRSRPSQKFLKVLLMLKTWFHRQREEKQTSGNSDDCTTEPATKICAQTSGESKQHNFQDQGPQSAYSPANTPLRLLSEVATGNSGRQSRSGSISHYPKANDWQQQMQLNNYPMNQSQMTQGYGNMGVNNIDPSIGIVGTDLGSSMGNALEQAMGMTLGVGDYGNFFAENQFFSGFVGDLGYNIWSGQGNFEGGA
ncbi:c6 zinc finger domain containing protein [Diplocarpon rosae]|nr:c6 zinc finger domain containing protein [Diplocarpon rosae]